MAFVKYSKVEMDLLGDERPEWLQSEEKTANKKVENSTSEEDLEQDVKKG